MDHSLLGMTFSPEMVPPKLYWVWYVPCIASTFFRAPWPSVAATDAIPAATSAT